MKPSLQQLRKALVEIFGDSARLIEGHGELTLEVSATQLLETMQRLRDEPALLFDSLIDVAGVDYQEFTGREPDAPRFGVVYHMLSIRQNWRLRVRVFTESETEPVVPSLVSLWPSANWMERECFDMFGIVFDDHPDLRRILTDYGFAGYPLRKDFPLSGHLEVRYDPEQKRVVCEPVSIEPRNNVPRIIRDPHYGDNTPMPIPPSDPPKG
jgi:NADH-quinone oxidoreductase subunit C